MVEYQAKEIFKELQTLFNQVIPDDTIRTLTEEKQQGVALFFCRWAEEMIKESDNTDVVRLAGQLTRAFCLGHNWTAKHWTLWDKG